jgi:hypothetical protein
MKSREAYQEYLQSDHWKKLRMQRLRMSKVCELCGTGKSKHWNVHHVIYRDNWLDAQVEDLRRMCRYCHECLHEEERAGRLILAGNTNQRWASTVAHFKLWQKPVRKQKPQPQPKKRAPDKRVMNAIFRVKSAVKVGNFDLARSRTRELLALLEPATDGFVVKFLSPTECMQAVTEAVQGEQISMKRWMWRYTLSCGHQLSRRGEKAMKSMYCHECMKRG